MTQYSKSEQLNQLAEILRERFGIVTQTDLNKAMTDLMKSTAQRTSRSAVSLSTIVRGLRIRAGQAAINAQSAEEDVRYLEQHCQKALVTTGPPGSYIVPVLQADEIIAYLNWGSVARTSGIRIWPLDGIQKLNVPTALQAPTWVWSTQTSATTATDPNLGQLAFDLLERRCLVAIPNQLLAVSVPAFDTILSTLIGLAAGEHEDTFLFASTQVSGAPINIIGNANISVVNAGGGSANGGNLAYTDLLAVLAKAASVKAKPPFCWYSSPRTFFTRIMGLVDLQSRPIFLPTLSQGLEVGPKGTWMVGYLLGFPVYVTPFISETEAVGSGSNQSHLIFTNPAYIHLAQDSTFSLAVSTEFLFSSNETALRAVSHLDAGVAPAAGVVMLQGIN